MSFRLPLSIAVTFLLATSGCGPVPQPFRTTPGEKEQAQIVKVEHARAVHLAVLGGVPEAGADALLEAVAERLRAGGIPASTNPALTEGPLVVANAWKGDASVSIRWEVYDADQDLVHAVTTEAPFDEAMWRSADPAVFRVQAEQVASALGPVLLPPDPVARPPFRPRVAVAEVAGAPGDGDRALARALTVLMREAGLPVTDALAEANVFVLAEVAVTSETDRADKVAITWTVARADGETVGRITQENRVRKGALDGPWGDAAFDAALPIVDAVGEVLSALREAGPGRDNRD